MPKNAELRIFQRNSFLFYPRSNIKKFKMSFSSSSVSLDTNPKAERRIQMTIRYKTSYLSDGTKVKITEELFNNLKVWEAQGYELEDKFKDELKKQDDVWLNSYRQYYRKSVSFEAETEKENPNQSILHDTSQDIENIIMQNEREHIIYSILDECTETQRRRFIKYYYLGCSNVDIAKQEGCYESAVRKSIKKVEKRIIFIKYLL